MLLVWLVDSCFASLTLLKHLTGIIKKLQIWQTFIESAIFHGTMGPRKITSAIAIVMLMPLRKWATLRI
jgi:hypothetical protein